MIVQKWDTYEFSLNIQKQYDNPFREVKIEGEFMHEDSGKEITVNGFYDGGTCWRIRFMPTETGVWRYVTTSNDPELDGKEGAFTCIEPQYAYLHGPLTCNENHFFHMDGTPRYLISTRVTSHLSPQETWEKAVDYLKEHRINRIFFMMGALPQIEKKLFGEGPDFSRYNVETFRAIDTFIDYLRRNDIIASPYFYYFNGGLQHKMTKEDDYNYLTYGMARFGAYVNVMPVLANEVEQKYTTSRDKIPYDLRSHEWCNEMGRHLSSLAVFGLPVTVHNPMEAFDAKDPGFYALLRDWPFPWTKCMLRQAQVGALGAADDIGDDASENTNPIFNARGYARHNQLLSELTRFGIPVINEEPGYEMAGYVWEDGRYSPRSWNTQNPNTVLRTFWTALTAGAYAMWGHCDTYETGDPLPGIKRTITPKYLKFLHDFITALPYWEMHARNDLVSSGDVLVDEKPYRTNFCLAKEGECYVVFSLNGGDVELQLSPGVAYSAVQMNAQWFNKSEPVAVAGGKRKFVLKDKDSVLLVKRSVSQGK